MLNRKGESLALETFDSREIRRRVRKRTGQSSKNGQNCTYVMKWKKLLDSPYPASCYVTSLSSYYYNAFPMNPPWHSSPLYSATQTAAMPIPVPTHILVTPTFSPRLLNSYNNVLTCLAPVQPSGCPKAIAPPFGLIFS